VRLRSVGLRIYSKLFEFGELVTLSFRFWSSLFFVGSVDELVLLIKFYGT
jgi:hypothetical protein